MYESTVDDSYQNLLLLRVLATLYYAMPASLAGYSKIISPLPPQCVRRRKNSFYHPQVHFGLKIHDTLRGLATSCLSENRWCRLYRNSRFLETWKICASPLQFGLLSL